MQFLKKNNKQYTHNLFDWGITTCKQQQHTFQFADVIIPGQKHIKEQ